MRRVMILMIVAVWMVGVGAGRPVLAGPIVLDENFDNQHGGVGALNFRGFSGWSVSNGSVDLIGNGLWDLLPGMGLYVDLDGSTNDAGVLASPEFSLDPGTYRVEFSLAGNRRNAATDEVTVRFGDWVQTFHVLASQPLEAYSFDVPVAAPTAVRLSFENHGGDNIGALLDDARVFSIPTPAGAVALALMIASLALRRGR